VKITYFNKKEIGKRVRGVILSKKLTLNHPSLVNKGEKTMILMMTRKREKGKRDICLSQRIVHFLLSQLLKFHKKNILIIKLWSYFCMHILLKIFFFLRTIQYLLYVLLFKRNLMI